MSNKLKICREAALLAGFEAIQSLTEDTVQARMAIERYDAVYDRILTMDKWDFALKRVELIKFEDGQEDFEYKNKFLLPSDFLSLSRFLNNGKDIKQPEKYIVTGKYILVNENKLAIEYSARVDEELITNDLRNAITYDLASELALSVAEDKQKSQILTQKAEYYIMLSMSNNIIGKAPQKMFKSKYLQAKYGS